MLRLMSNPRPASAPLPSRRGRAERGRVDGAHRPRAGLCQPAAGATARRGPCRGGVRLGRQVRYRLADERVAPVLEALYCAFCRGSVRGLIWADRGALAEKKTGRNPPVRPEKVNGAGVRSEGQSSRCDRVNSRCRGHNKTISGGTALKDLIEPRHGRDDIDRIVDALLENSDPGRRHQDAAPPEDDRAGGRPGGSRHAGRRAGPSPPEEVDRFLGTTCRSDPKMPRGTSPLPTVGRRKAPATERVPLSSPVHRVDRSTGRPGDGPLEDGTTGSIDATRGRGPGSRPRPSTGWTRRDGCASPAALRKVFDDKSVAGVVLSGPDGRFPAANDPRWRGPPLSRPISAR